MEGNKRLLVVNLVSAGLFFVGFVIRETWLTGLALGMVIGSNAVKW